MREAHKWITAPAVVDAECERLFQAGGPRVYILEPAGHYRPTDLSGTRAARYADPEQTVFARRKSGRQYVWMQAIDRAVNNG